MKEGSAPIRPQDVQVPPEALALIPRATAERFRICPLGFAETRSGQRALTIAIADTNNLMVLDQLQQLVGSRIHAVTAFEPDIMRGIEAHYTEDTHTDTPTDLLKQFSTGEEQPSAAVTAQTPTIPQATVQQGGARQTVEGIMQRAIADRASDIHIEPHAKTVYVRCRIDGVMYDQMTYDPPGHPSVISYIKVLSKLDIAQNRLPQDGRFEVGLGNKDFDVRVSIIPSTGGEKAVLRLLPKTPIAMEFEQLGIEGQNLKYLQQMLAKPFGMLLATGPTGSGKTTTLYTCLSRIDCVSKNVITVEDPVEYQFARMTQIQVYPKIGLTFAAGLRAILRQDPDIIMVGEIRDLDTLEIAVQSALTGHLVLSTLHCNDAAAGAARMVDMGAEPFLVASSLNGIIAQRLVRKICAACKTEFKVSDELRQTLHLPDDGTVYYHGTGCAACRGTGYSGRMSVFEIVPVIEPIQQAIIRKAPSGEIRTIIKDAKLPSLQEDAMCKVRAGITSLEEVLRAVYTMSG